MGEAEAERQLIGPIYNSGYNLDPASLERLVAREGKAPMRVPYRCNRAMIFDSSLIHESGGVRFRPGYANRRINLTLLFGERAGG